MRQFIDKPQFILGIPWWGGGGGGLCLNPPTDLINGVPHLRRAIISAASWEVQLKNRFHLTIGSGRYYICLRSGLYATFRVDKWKRSTVKMLKFTNCAVSCSGNRRSRWLDRFANNTTELSENTTAVKHHAETYSDSSPPPSFFPYCALFRTRHYSDTTNTCKIIKLKFNFISVNQALGQTSPPRICE